MKLEIPNAQRVRTGDPRLMTLEIPDGFRLALSKLYRRAEKQGDRLRVTLETIERKRSTGKYSQNHHLNGHCQQIAQDTGNTFDDVKLYVKRQAFNMGLRFLEHDDGTPVVSMNDHDPLPISEADMTTEECGWCIEAAHILAGELNIMLIETEEVA